MASLILLVRNYGPSYAEMIHFEAECNYLDAMPWNSGLLCRIWCNKPHNELQFSHHDSSDTHIQIENCADNNISYSEVFILKFNLLNLSNFIDDKCTYQCFHIEKSSLAVQMVHRLHWTLIDFWPFWTNETFTNIGIHFSRSVFWKFSMFFNLVREFMSFFHFIQHNIVSAYFCVVWWNVQIWFTCHGRRVTFLLSRCQNLLTIQTHVT